LKSSFQTLFLIILSLLVSASLAAQTHRASVRGTVYDPKGAAIPGASISLTSLETGDIRSATTNSDGEYAISSLPPGDYDIKSPRPKV
jgi:protocatechuate 3,4-dioxygenase beta subunit